MLTAQMNHCCNDIMMQMTSFAPLSDVHKNNHAFVFKLANGILQVLFNNMELECFTQ